MIHRIELLSEKKLLGKYMTMSLANNSTHLLWKEFMQQRHNIQNNIDSFLYSLQVFEADYNFQNIDLNREFTKWAAVEVSSFETNIPDMHEFILPEGLYAVFLHKGGPEKAPETFQHIFGQWFTQSKYTLDQRPHFEKLGEKYKNNSIDSEEEIWIPIIEK